jgi:MFS family permease
MRELFAPEEMGKAFGVYSPVMGLSAMLGPIISGGLIGLDVLGTGWRMIFLVNLPVGAFALITGARLLPAAAPQAGDRSLDLPGTVLAGVGVFMLTFGLVQGHELLWPLSLIGLTAGSLPVLAGFAAYQRRRKASGRTPLIEPSIFTRRA